MVQRFCPQCGAPATQGAFCDEHTPSKDAAIEVAPIQISEYNRVYEKKTWHSFSDIESLIVSRVQAVVGKVPVRIDSFEFVPKPKSKTIVTTHAQINKKLVTIPVKLSYRQCDVGQKQKSGYFEGVLQLRNPSDAVQPFIEKETHQLIKKGAFITKTVPVKNGVDLYLTDKHQMQLLASKLVNRFGGSMALHPTLFSHNHQTSKDIYRLTVLVEFPPFAQFDVISFVPQKIRGEGQKIWLYITKLGKLMHGVNLESGKLIAVEHKLMGEIEVLKKYQTSVVQIHPELLVLDPQTYQGEPVRNAQVLKKTYMNDQKVAVAKTEIGLLLVEE